VTLDPSECGGIPWIRRAVLSLGECRFEVGQHSELSEDDRPGGASICPVAGSSPKGSCNGPSCVRAPTSADIPTEPTGAVPIPAVTPARPQLTSNGSSRPMRCATATDRPGATVRSPG
jgi:hypothetical protein